MLQGVMMSRVASAHSREFGEHRSVADRCVLRDQVGLVTFSVLFRISSLMWVFMVLTMSPV